ncbi:MAG: stealth conserved region 3 domain-containing protein [Betaproteobacteria bacterium]|nr:stealth conserved region 3 domain-containing protein [Betaproteobacteria bacterium]
MSGIDLAYTWVDDAFPGYAAQLGQYARKQQDSNPNRTRDNLELLRYSLRSVARYAPWVRNIYLFTMRPQVPAWLDAAHPRVRIVHHDELMDPAHLPTFNSFALYTHLHRLPGISSPFLFLEDDMLFRAPVTPQDFWTPDGRLRVFPRYTRTAPPEHAQRTDLSPWNAALARANQLLDARFGPARRRAINHAPLPIDPELWREMLETWPEVTEHTRASRFRSLGNVPPEYLYAHYALLRGRAVAHPARRTWRDVFYFPLENWPLHARLQTALIDRLQPKCMNLNDNFGPHPHPGVAAHLRATLRRWYPEPGPWEIAA